MGICAAALMCWGVLAALCAAAEPATVKIVVANEDGQPFAGASVALFADMDAAEEKRTDERGEATFTLPTVDGSDCAQWDVALSIEADGHIRKQLCLELFSGAKIARRCILQKALNTRIELRDTDGTPLKRQMFSVDGVYGQTDDAGRCVLVAPRRQHPIFVAAGEVVRRFNATGEDIIVTVLGAKPARSIRLKVLDVDGRPADGWFVAQRAKYSASGLDVSGGPTNRYYTIIGVQKLGADAEALLPTADECLVLFSPQGIPLMFPLAPESWPEGTHALTLRIPPVRWINEGRLSTPDGKPVAHYPLRVDEVQSCGQHWSIQHYNNIASGRPIYLEPLELVHPIGPQIWRTTKDGGYQVPCYFGMQMTVYGGTRGYPTQELSSGGPVTFRRSKARGGPEKHIIIACRDAQGQAVREQVLVEFKAYAGKECIVSGANMLQVDERGVHQFVPLQTDRVVATIDSKDHRWARVTREFALTAEREQVLEIVMPEELRQLSISGVVLGLAGQPVVNACVTVLEWQQFGPHKQLGAFRSPVQTNEKGEFTFSSAPDEGLLKVSREDFKTLASDLPGWTAPIEFGRAQRNVTIRLNPGATVQVFYPSGQELEPNFLYPSSNQAPQSVPTVYSLGYDSQQQCWRASSVPPGEYLVWAAAPMGGSSLGQVKVIDNADISVALRGKQVSPTVGAENLWQEVTVSLDGKPLSGASVWICAPAARKNGAGDDGYRTVHVDISDQNGQIRFQGLSETRYCAVARLPGRWMGWQTFTSNAQHAINIEVQKCRTMSVRLPPLAQGQHYDSRLVSITAPALKEIERATLWRALGIVEEESLGSGMARFFGGYLRAEAGSTRIVEDLPTGQEYVLTVGGLEEGGPLERTVRLEPGPDPLETVDIQEP
jgi:hypothetical protein